MVDVVEYTIYSGDDSVGTRGNLLRFVPILHVARKRSFHTLSWGCEPVPTWVGDSVTGIGRHTLAVCRHRAGPVDDQPAGRVVEAEEVQLRPGGGVEDVRE